MILPNSQSAVVSREKVRDYLLNARHPDNGGKAAFFQALGFHPGNWQALSDALLDLARIADVEKTLESPHGVKYIVDGRLRSSSGASASVRTVWIADKGKDTPRLVTAYPRGA